MGNRQIVVISGKTCSGKSGLANLLKSEFGFNVLRSKELIPHPQPAGIDLGTTSDDWILNATESYLNDLELNTPVVVDHLNTPEQVFAFRRRFGESLIHVHLFASEEDLHSRYKATAPAGAPPFDEINLLQSQVQIEALKQDADVRIYTTHADARDTLVRVAARLHLYTSPDVRCVDVLIGGQYGSEGKGNVVAYLAREYDVMVRVGGPNAGHTVAAIDGMYTYHHLPSGSRDVTARLLLGPGMTIKLPGLLKEISDCRIGPDRLFIDPQATIIEEEDTELEKDHLVSVIASTGSGSGGAAARRIINRGKGPSGIRLARDVPELAPYVGSKENYHGRTADRLEEAYRKGQSILLEGTQGSGLSLFHGDYPYVTSRDTNVAGCLAEAGISPSRVRKILMVIRPMPIRVGNPDGKDGNISGPLKHETSFTAIAEGANLDAEALNSAEKTSTTKRNRRVGWFEWEQFRRACALNAPTDLVLTFADYLGEHNRHARRFEQLTDRTIRFIEELERVSQAPVSLINTRFTRENDGSNDLRSLIDRRNWTARSNIRNQ